MVAPIHNPRSSVTILVISFSEALFKRSTQPLSRSKLPSMTVPIKGAPLGARIEAKIVTAIGKTILVVFDIGCLFATPMTICLSFSVVRTRIIGGRSIAGADHRNRDGVELIEAQSQGEQQSKKDSKLPGRAQ